MSTPRYQIRADFDEQTIVVYQAFSPAIAEPALAAQTFVPPFSFQRMTWIKPSFLWLMERSRWGQSANQERTLAVRITRAGWEEALRKAALTSPRRGVYGSTEEWERALEQAPIRVQWDPERSIHGGKLEHRSVQVGIARTFSETYAREWVREIRDLSPLVAKLRGLRREGEYDKARRLLPPERPYPAPEDIRRALGMDAED
jgi:hypothetical protein